MGQLISKSLYIHYYSQQLLKTVLTADVAELLHHWMDSVY